MAAKSGPTPAQQRERRSKIAAVVLGIVFLGVAAIQGPKLMSQLSGKKPAAVAEPASTDASGSSGSGESSSGGGTNGGGTNGASGTSTGGTASVVSVRSVSGGLLTHFSQFDSKDPFKSLVKNTMAAATGKPGATTPATGQKLAVVPPAGTQPSGSVTFTQTPGATAPGGQIVPAALILYNGKKLVVALGASFPEKNPVFRLVSLSLKTVRIGLVGGSFANGKTTLPLPHGNKITLANSSTGSKYVLRLLKLTTAPKPVVVPKAIPGVGGAAATTTTTASTTG